ncbi:glycosyltransferase family 2 protein [Virgibacillus sp. JSM 102003]|uniref:glycosyltransferase family 2 protein n=1 Tax=Virgibacillus sp. JSM 102003 TaxID=1562108 RepID=UPI0035BF09A2
MSDVLVIIPAYNEEKSIFQTVTKLRNYNDYDYIVINDGSKDSTEAILHHNELPYINLPVNLGIGGAMQTGFRYARKKGYKYAIQLDADGQHDPNDLQMLVDAIQLGNQDMIIGSRFVEKSQYKGSSVRRVGIYYFYYLILFLTGNKITDPTSGYRIINKEIIKEFANYYPVDYPEVEVLVDLAKKKFSVKEIKVEMNNRQGGTSSITPVKSIYYMIKVSFFSLIRRVL